jgi:hypothetical protein
VTALNQCDYEMPRETPEPRRTVQLCGGPYNGRQANLAWFSDLSALASPDNEAQVCTFWFRVRGDTWRGRYELADTGRAYWRALPRRWL